MQRQSTSDVSVCVAGCGHWGRNLVRNFDALGNLAAVCESDERALASMAALYPKAKAYREFSDALANPSIDAVVLATPARDHYSMAMAALSAGKDVFVEKPLALRAEEGQEMMALAHRTHHILMVGHLLRYHPALDAIQALIAEGALGRIEYLYSNRLSMGKIRREENALWSFAPHDISMLLAITGQMPLQVSATGGAYLQPNIADVTISQLLFEQGTRAHIFVSWLHPYKEHRVVILGSKQMVLFEDTAPDNKLRLFDKRIEIKDGAFEAAKPVGKPVPYDLEEPLRRECRHFIDCVFDRRTPRTSAEEGVRVLQVLQACERSLQTSGQLVSVPI
jgi:UDP-2-acetamido-3-amino-2,3-dideoxy-glucuronate N-acetyltransferase